MLDPDALAPFLASELGLTGPVAVTPFGGGYSNLTDRVTVGDATVVVRRPPPGADVRGGHDVVREARILQAVAGRVPVPRVLAVEETGAVLGVPFSVSEFVDGPILRGTTRVRPDAATMDAVADALVGTMVRLHALDAAPFAAFGRPASEGGGYVARQVAGWTRRYAAARTETVPDLERALAWMAGHAPPDAGTALVHNDLKHDNVILAGLGEAGSGASVTVRAVLDWELATVGDPLMDVGSTLGYWTEPDDPPALLALAPSPTAWPGSPGRAEVVRRYAEASGRDVPHAVFYAVYGHVKLAVIAQQIYKRWTLGHARDPRFEHLNLAVAACGAAAGRAVDTGRVSP